MLITYLKDENLLKIEAIEINDFITNINSYLSVKIDSSLNCGTSISKTETTTEVIDNTKGFYISNSILYIKPIFFNLTTFIDSIIKLKITFIKYTGYVIIENCIFIDITYKCKVAVYLQGIIEETKIGDKTDKIATNIHLLHYGLVNGSNCGCNCEEMCNIFKELTSILVLTPKNTDCGC